MESLWEEGTEGERPSPGLVANAMAFRESIKARGLAWWRGQSSRDIQAECARSLAEPGCPPKSFSAPQIREDGLLCTSQQPAWPRLLEVTVVTASSHMHPSQCAHQSPGSGSFP